MISYAKLSLPTTSVDKVRGAERHLRSRRARSTGGPRRSGVGGQTQYTRCGFRPPWGAARSEPPARQGLQQEQAKAQGCSQPQTIASHSSGDRRRGAAAEDSIGYLPAEAAADSQGRGRRLAPVRRRTIRVLARCLPRRGIVPRSQASRVNDGEIVHLSTFARATAFRAP